MERKFAQKLQQFKPAAISRKLASTELKETIQRLQFRDYNLKINFRYIPNYVTKSKNGRETFIDFELDECKDYSGVFYNLGFHKVCFLF